MGAVGTGRRKMLIPDAQAVGKVANRVVVDAGRRSGRLLVSGFIVIDVAKMQAATANYELETVGKAWDYFCDLATATGRVPTIDDGGELVGSVRACFNRLVGAVLA